MCSKKKQNEAGKEERVLKRKQVANGIELIGAMVDLK